MAARRGRRLGRRTSSTAAASTWTPAATPSTPRPNAPRRPRSPSTTRPASASSTWRGGASQRERPGMTVTVAKNNVGPIHADEATWGCHESYTLLGARRQGGRAAGAAPRQPPHLRRRRLPVGPRRAARASSCRSGPATCAGHRHRHDQQPADLLHAAAQGRPTTAPGTWTRAHLIAKDSQRAPFGIYLTFGTTGLLFQMINDGRKVGRGWRWPTRSRRRRPSPAITGCAPACRWPTAAR